MCVHSRYHFPNVSQIFYSLHSQRNFEHIHMASSYMHPCLHILVLLCVSLRFIWLYLYIIKWFISPLAHSSLYERFCLFAQEYVSFVEKLSYIYCCSSKTNIDPPINYCIQGILIVFECGNYRHAITTWLWELLDANILLAFNTFFNM